MDDKMKMLFNAAHHISWTITHRQNNPSAELRDNNNCSVIDKLVFTKDK